MRRLFPALSALLLAGAAVAQGAGGASVLDPQAKVPPVEFRSAFKDYRPFSDQELRDWRSANEEVGAAGGHAGHRPGQGAGRESAKPQPETSGKAPGKSPDAPPHDGHGAHK